MGVKDKLYRIGPEKRTTGRLGASAGTPERVLVDYDDGVRKAHEELQHAKVAGEFNEDFYRGFCACMRGFGRAREVTP